MELKLVLRGVLAGAFAGLCAFVFARIFAEPKISQAIDYESARDAAQDALDKAQGVAVPAAGPDLFSRTVQGNVGIGVGIIAFGAAMGALVAIVYAVCLGRVGRMQPKPLALLVCLFGFLGLYLVPFVKYPANPPSIGHEDTIRERGGLYLVLVAVSIVALALAVWGGQRLARRLGNWSATLLAALGFVVILGVVMALLPDLGHIGNNVADYGNHATETPQPLRDAAGRIVFPGFPADLLWSFRFLSVAAQLLLWGVLALVFAPLADRVLRPVMQDEERAEALAG